VAGTPSTDRGKMFSGFSKCHGVYVIYNWKTKKRYVGFTSGPFGIRGRLKIHVYDLEHGKHHNKPMQEDWNLDSECWGFGVLEVTENKERELYWIDYCNSINTGYNIAYGTNYTEEMREKQRGIKPSAESNAKRSSTMLGVPKSEETKAKMRKPKSAEAIRNMTEARRRRVT
jgi:group I intron endonuclease